MWLYRSVSDRVLCPCCDTYTRTRSPDALPPPWRVIELDRAEQVPLIGHGHRRHLPLDVVFMSWVDIAGAIQKGMSGMAMQVNKRHDRVGPSQTAGHTAILTGGRGGQAHPACRCCVVDRSRDAHNPEHYRQNSPYRHDCRIGRRRRRYARLDDDDRASFQFGAASAQHTEQILG